MTFSTSDAVGRALRFARRPDIGSIRALAWAAVALRRVRRALPRDGLDTRTPPPPPLPAAAGRGVTALLDLAHASCLERSLIIQAWLADHGRTHDVVVALPRAEGEFAAHAWVERYDDPADADTYEVFTRVAPRPPTTGAAARAPRGR